MYLGFIHFLFCHYVGMNFQSLPLQNDNVATSKKAKSGDFMNVTAF